MMTLQSYSHKPYSYVAKKLKLFENFVNYMHDVILPYDTFLTFCHILAFPEIFIFCIVTSVKNTFCCLELYIYKAVFTYSKVYLVSLYIFIA